MAITGVMYHIYIHLIQEQKVRAVDGLGKLWANPKMQMNTVNF